MKIYDYKNLSLFLHTLFDFFKKNGIESGLEKLTDYESMLKIILNSEFIKFYCYPGIEQYGVSFIPEHIIEERVVYSFLFGSESKESKGNAHFLIDIDENEFPSFIEFSWYEEKLPPFFYDFINENGMLLVNNYEGPSEERNIKSDEIMTFDDFDIFLKLNKEQKQLKCIEVD